MWIVLGYDPNHPSVTPHDETFFLVSLFFPTFESLVRLDSYVQIVAVAVVVGGLFFSLFFQIFTKEPLPAQILNQRDRSKEVANGTSVESHTNSAMTWRDWLKNLQFYEVGLM